MEAEMLGVLDHLDANAPWILDVPYLKIPGLSLTVVCHFRACGFGVLTAVSRSLKDKPM
jgi:hypothetical protein